MNYVGHHDPHHFARPCSSSTIPRVGGTLSFLPDDDHSRRSVLDHCRGLLCETEWGGELYVCNSATCRWTVLPPPSADGKRHQHYTGAYVAFDPAESPHYQVILVPAVPAAPLSLKDRRRRAEQEWCALLREEEKDAPFCLDRLC